MLQARKRTKRDSVTNLYNQCRISGNCPDDVKNKVEGTTLADTLLKIFGGLVYFGGLGIGTGRGTGGATGYRPLGAGTGSSGGGRVTSGGTVIRPNVVIDPVGPPDIITVDSVNPSSSSLVPLLEVGPEIGPEVDITTEAAGPDLGIPETSVITTTDPVSDVINIGGAPTVTTIDDTAAVLEVQPTLSSTPKRVATSSFDNPTFVSVHTSTLPEPSNTTDVFVDSAFGGTLIGGNIPVEPNLEEIPLETFNERLEFDIEEPGPKTSTPKEKLESALIRAREYYNRRVQQVRTRNPKFVAGPRQAVTFEFENPAFTADDVSLVFEQDVSQLATAAPDPDFADIIRLGRPTFSETDTGNIRLSRLGQRGTIRLRSGTQIGQKVHFYYDFSTIDSAEAIELTNLGHHSGDASILNPLAEGTIVDASNIDEDVLFPDEALVDPQTENFSDSHLVLSSSSRRSVMTVPTLPPGVALRVFVQDVGDGLFVSYPEYHDDITIYPVPTEPLQPAIIIDPFSSVDFILHPSLKRKRKRIIDDYL